MRLKLFWRRNCATCIPAKAVCEGLRGEGLEVEYVDMEELEGRAEAAFYQVMATPTAVLVDGRGEEVASWRGVIPDRGDILRRLREG